MCASSVCTRLGVDHRADIGGQPGRIAEREFPHRTLQHLQHAVGNVFLQAQHAQRRAALAGAVERGHQHVLHHLLRQRGRIDHHRVLAAGLGDQRNLARHASAGASVRWMSCATSVEPVNITPRTRASPMSCVPTVSPRPGQKLQRRARNAGLVQQLYRMRRDQRRLLGGLCEHGVAGGERGAHLADEDRERKIPRADADYRPKRLGLVDICELGLRICCA